MQLLVEVVGLSIKQYTQSLMAVLPYLPCSGIKADKVSSGSKTRVEAVIVGTDDDGHSIVREFNKAPFTAIRAFLLHLYTDAVNHIDPEIAINVLQLAMWMSLEMEDSPSNVKRC